MGKNKIQIGGWEGERMNENRNVHYKRYRKIGSR
jgi:hypothetical protein